MSCQSDSRVFDGALMQACDIKKVFVSGESHASFGAGRRWPQKGLLFSGLRLLYRKAMNGEKEPAIRLSSEITYGHILQAAVVMLMIGGFWVTDHSTVVELRERIAAVERGQAETRVQFQRISDAREHDVDEIRAKIEKVQELIVDGMRTAIHK
jgi:hypothetical protein